MISSELRSAEVVAADALPAAPATPARGLAGREILALDGVRGVAILLVVWCHLGVPPVSMDLSAVNTFASSGVLLFFVLSGLLLFLPYARAVINSAPWPSWRRFYARRIRRIVPVYMVALVVFLALYARHAGGIGVLFQQHGLSLVLMATLLHDLTTNAWNFVAGLDAPLWSLATEWQFYLVLPLIAVGLRWLAGTKVGRRGVVLGVIALLVAGLAVRTAMTLAHTAWQWPDPVFPLLGMRGKYWQMFALGMFAALVYVWGVEGGRLSRPWAARIGLFASAAGLAVLALGYAWGLNARRFPYDGASPEWAPATLAGSVWNIAGEWTLALGYACLILGALLGPRLLSLAWSWRPLRFLGLISYSVYIWHYPLIARLHQMQLPFTGAYPTYIGVTAPLLVIVGWASYRLLERPFLAARRTP